MFDCIDKLIFGLRKPLSSVIIFFFMSLAGLAAYRKKSLTLSGTFAAMLLGFCVTVTLHFEGLALFLVFFVLSNAAGKLSKRTAVQAGDVGAKTGPRDAFQVFANGVMAAFGGVWWYYSSSEVARAVFAVAVAESFADTLAGDIGKLSPVPPVSVLTLRRVEKGVSGGVTILGFFASFCASALISVLWVLFFRPLNPALAGSLVCLSAFSGSVLDSVLGAGIQAVYRDREGKYTEKAVDDDGRRNTLVRGIPVINNDMVNFISNAVSVFLICRLYLIFE